MHDASLCTRDFPAEQPEVKRACRLPIGEVALTLFSVPSRPAVWPAELTESEQAVARHLIGGLSYRDIARRRGVSEETVSAQVSAMMRKLRVDSAHRLVARLAALRFGPVS